MFTFLRIVLRLIRQTYGLRYLYSSSRRRSGISRIRVIHSSNLMSCSSNVCFVSSVIFGCLAILRIEGCLKKYPLAAFSESLRQTACAAQRDADRSLAPVLLEANKAGRCIFIHLLIYMFGDEDFNFREIKPTLF